MEKLERSTSRSVGMDWLDRHLHVLMHVIGKIVGNTSIKSLSRDHRYCIKSVHTSRDHSAQIHTSRDHSTDTCIA